MPKHNTATIIHKILHQNDNVIGDLLFMNDELHSVDQKTSNNVGYLLQWIDALPKEMPNTKNFLQSDEIFKEIYFRIFGNKKDKLCTNTLNSAQKIRDLEQQLKIYKQKIVTKPSMIFVWRSYVRGEKHGPNSGFTDAIGDIHLFISEKNHSKNEIHGIFAHEYFHSACRETQKREKNLAHYIIEEGFGSVFSAECGNKKYVKQIMKGVDKKVISTFLAKNQDCLSDKNVEQRKQTTHGEGLGHYAGYYLAKKYRGAHPGEPWEKIIRTPFKKIFLEALESKE